MPKPEHINSERSIAPGEQRSDAHTLRTLVYGVTACWTVLYVVLALRFNLHWYADGSIFTYAILVRDAWDFHWHNISGRAFVYLYAHIPAEAFLALTGSAAGAQTLYATLFFAAPLAGLAATYAADETPRRTIFLFACASTALVLPLVFGFPTEMWISHAAFWPTLALAHAGRPGLRAQLLLTLATTALVMSHAGGLLLAIGVTITLVPLEQIATTRQRVSREDARTSKSLERFSDSEGTENAPAWRDTRMRRSLAALAVAVAVFVGFSLAFPPDDYISAALEGAARNFLRPDNFSQIILRVLAAAALIYGLAYALLQRLGQADSHLKAAGAAALVLVLYWLRFDTSLHAEMRYPLRTSVLLFPSLLGGTAALLVLHQANAIAPPLHLLTRLAQMLQQIPPRALAGAFMVLTLVHAVETAKFIAAWHGYAKAVRDLAMSEASDPDLGSPHFASAARLGEDRNRLSWGSTTHFLSVLVAPDLRPRRLVVDPDTNYFYISCATATRSFEAQRGAVPVASRALIRNHACLHR